MKGYEKMNIGIDIDDTITNSSDVFVKYAQIYNETKNINYEINKYEIDKNKAFGWSKLNENEFQKKYLEKILTEAKPLDDSVKIINKLFNIGYNIIFISSRKDSEVNNVYDLTIKWLKRYNIKYTKLIVNSMNKLNDCISNDIDIFIDDNYENCKLINDYSNIKTFLYKTRYNTKMEFPCFNNWVKIYETITSFKRNKDELKYIDVDKREDFPIEPEGLRFIHFYGGKKNYCGYLAKSDLSRADFMENYPQYVPIQNQPVYNHNGIILRADPKYPCPGFYILSLDKTYRAFDLIDDLTFIRFTFILKKAKEGMRKALNINYAHLLSNEKSDPYVNVHFWLVPVNGITSPDLLDFDVKKYLSEFVPKNEINKIIEFNRKLQIYFENIDLIGQDDQLANKLKEINF